MHTILYIYRKEFKVNDKLSECWEVQSPWEMLTSFGNRRFVYFWLDWHAFSFCQTIVVTSNDFPVHWIPKIFMLNTMLVVFKPVPCTMVGSRGFVYPEALSTEWILWPWMVFKCIANMVKSSQHLLTFFRDAAPADRWFDNVLVGPRSLFEPEIPFQLVCFSNFS